MLEHNNLSQIIIITRTLNYLAPECVMIGRTSPKSNVYSFGVMAFEISIGKRVVDVSLQEHHTRPMKWVWDLYGQ